MKRRYLYLLLFGIPGLLLSGIIAGFVLVLATGVFWLFVFGDNPWPAAAQPALLLGMGLVFLILWVASLVAGYLVGKRREQDARLNRMHLLVSAGLTALLLLTIGATALADGSHTPASAEERCSRFCSAKGYSASGVSPRSAADRTCSCLGANGGTVIEVPLESVK